MSLRDYNPIRRFLSFEEIDKLREEELRRLGKAVEAEEHARLVREQERIEREQYARATAALRAQEPCFDPDCDCQDPPRLGDEENDVEWRRPWWYGIALVGAKALRWVVRRVT